MVGHQNRDSLELRLAAEPASVRVARRAVAEFAAENGVDDQAVALAVSEAVTNAVVHAYTDGGPGEVLVSVRPNGEGMVVVVADQGRGIQPNPDSPGLGFGLALLASVADEVGIGPSPEGGTAVRMRFVPAG